MNTEDIKKEEERLLSENLTEVENKFPSLFVQTRNLMKQAWLSGTDLVKGRSFLSSPEKASARWEICKQCQFLHQNRCLKCGCFMEKKIHLESSQCPINKWGDLQTPFVMKNAPTSSLEVSIDSFPESDRERISEIALHAAQNNTPFHYGNKRYKSNLNQDGSLRIVDSTELNPEAQAPANAISIISGFSEDEKKQFNELVNQTKNSDNKIFNFLGYDFIVKNDGTRTFVSLSR